MLKAKLLLEMLTKLRVGLTAKEVKDVILTNPTTAPLVCPIPYFSLTYYVKTSSTKSSSYLSLGFSLIRYIATSSF